MHKSSSIVVILSIFIINDCVVCSPKREDQWWNHIIMGREAQHKNQWTSISSSDTPELIAQSTNRSVRRSDNNTDSGVNVRSRNWEKSYARRRDFDRTWNDNQPIRDRFVETEWDDDVPVRHVFRDSTSAVDEGSSRIRMGDDVKVERMSRVWTPGDDAPIGNTGRDGGTSFVKSSRNNNKLTNNNNKPKTSSSLNSNNNNNNQQSKTDRTGDRVLSLNFQDPEAKNRDKERLEKLAKEIFGPMGNNDNKVTTAKSSNGNSFGTTFRSTGFNSGNTGITTSRSNGNSGSGFVSNAVNSFTRSPGNSYVAGNGNGVSSSRGSTNNFGITRNTATDNNNKANIASNRNNFESVKPVKLSVSMFDNTTPKPDKSTNTIRSSFNAIQPVAEKPKSVTTPSTANNNKFGWRSSISHQKDQKQQQTQSQRLQDSTEEPIDDNFDDIDSDFDDDPTSTTARPTRGPITRPPTVRTTARPITIKTTVRPTMRSSVEYTTYRQTETTRPQISAPVTAKPVTTNRETTFTTTSRPKVSVPTPSDNLAPNKKQHRMGSWVDSETLDYDMGDNDNFEDPPFDDRSPPVDNGLEPLVDDVDISNERTDNTPDAPLAEEPKFARQSAATRETEDDQPGWRLEDALPGVPGTDYPTFGVIPRTNFDCKSQTWPGYYADVETQCQVFHICQTGGRKNSFLCPNGTMFNQQVFVCDWWHNVQCGDSTTHYALNENIYDHNWESKRISKSETEVPLKRSGALKEAAEADDLTTTIAPTESDVTDLADNKDESDTGSDDGVNDFRVDDEEDDNDEQMGRATRVRQPIRLYRTSRYIPALDRQKRRRRKRGYLKA